MAFFNKVVLKLRYMAEYICPHCKKPIYDDEALLCLYCGRSLQRGIGFMGKMKYPTRRILLIAFVILVVFAFALLVIR